MKCKSQLVLVWKATTPSALLNNERRVGTNKLGWVDAAVTIDFRFGRRGGRILTIDDIVRGIHESTTKGVGYGTI